MVRPLIVAFLFTSCLLAGQNDPADSLSRHRADSVDRARQIRKQTYAMPRRVTLMSVVVPGLGQIYNKQYWKVPVIYAGLGGFTYLFISANREYQYYRSNLKAIYDDDSSTQNTTGYSADNVQLQKVAYRKRRDLAAIGIGAIYLLNIIDANVSAHLKTFDVSDDLSLQVSGRPQLWPSASGINFGAGLSLRIKFN